MFPSPLDLHKLVMETLFYLHSAQSGEDILTNSVEKGQNLSCQNISNVALVW